MKKGFSLKNAMFRRGTLAILAAALVTVAMFPTTSSKASTRVNTVKLMTAATRKISPRYNQAAKSAKAQGQVEVEVTVGENGSVKVARAISGHAMLREDARMAAEQWRFDAAKLSDPPSEVVGVIVFNFKIDG